MIPYGRQSVTEEDVQGVIDVLRGDWLTCGPTVGAFEEALATYCGARHAIAVANGTAALHVAMCAARVGPGDRVMTSANTFLASANCAEFAGAAADFADIDADTLNLSPRSLRDAWHDDVRAVVAVDFAGRPCDMPAIAGVARQAGVLVIEDASHAIGSRFSHAGTEYAVGGHPWADMTTFSFHPVKTVTTGEGGAIVTSDDELAERCRRLRNHGMVKTRTDEPWFYEMNELGLNYRITDIQCALGASQLGRIDTFVARRADIVGRYDLAFADTPHLRTPAAAATGSRVAWHLYVVRIDYAALGKPRARVMSELRERGVGTQVHYIPVHLQPYYRRKYGYGPGKCPVAEAYYEFCLSLPLFPAMSDADVTAVIDAVREVVGP